MLRQVSVNAVDYKLCNATYANPLAGNDVNDLTQLCGGTVRGGKDACESDSGNPLFVGDDTVVGVVDDGIGCGKPNIPSINARVSGFSNWILDGICALSDSPPTSCRSGSRSTNATLVALQTPSTPQIEQPSQTNGNAREHHVGLPIVWTIGSIVLLLGFVAILKHIQFRRRRRHQNYSPIPNVMTMDV